MSLEVKVHRGSNQIGGNIIEICTESTRIIFDIGLSLNDAENVELPKIDGLFDDKKFDAIFVSHYHSDHLGLIYNVHKDIPVYIGKKSYDIICASNNYLNKPNFIVKGFLSNNVPINIGDIKVTPFLCDHSAYDSYMLFAESNEGNAFYTGDFRSNGRKSFKALLNNLPSKVDILICEGTTITRKSQKNRTEKNLENQVTKILKNNSGPIFVLQSSMNIDRLVTIYRAVKTNNRILLQDLYLALITSAIMDSIPNPISFSDVFVFITRPLNSESKRYKLFKNFNNRIGKNQISEKNFVMCVRSSMGKYINVLSKKMSFNDGVLIYSLWNGYLVDESMNSFIEQCKNLGLKIKFVHTSGHADIQTLKELSKHLNPSEIIPVHTENPEELIKILTDI